MDRIMSDVNGTMGISNSTRARRTDSVAKSTPTKFRSLIEFFSLLLMRRRTEVHYGIIYSLYRAISNQNVVSCSGPHKRSLVVESQGTDLMVIARE